MSASVLEIRDLSKTFHSKGISIKAVCDVSLDLKKGETVGVVGESGCGKTTLGRCIARGIKADAGVVSYHRSDGQTYDFLGLDKETMRKVRKDIQMIFQDPYSSLDPRMTVFDIIAEPLKANFKLPKEELDRRVKEIALKTGLDISYLRRYPHAFSGGQRQRIGIARSLVLNPQIVVCDEVVSALDVSIQAQIINLLKSLQNELGVSYIFISHDLAVVEHISDRVGVMYSGKMVEFADVEALYKAPLHPYTESLLSAVPVADPAVTVERIRLEGEIPDPANLPSGCYFHPRCRYKTEQCVNEAPVFERIGDGHSVACHRARELALRGCGVSEGS